MRSLRMNANRATIMRDRRTKGTQITLAAALLALSTAVFLLPIGGPTHDAGPERGISVHAKNSATPDWMLELQSRNARQAPVTVQNGEPSFWI